MDTLFVAYLFVHGATALVSLLLFFFYMKIYKRTRISLMLLMAALILTYGFTNFILFFAEIIPRSIGFSSQFYGIRLPAGWTVYDTLGVISAFGIGFVLVLGLLFFDSFKGIYSLSSVSFAIGTLVGLVVSVIATFLSSPKLVTDTAFINERTVVFVWSPLIWLLLGVLSLFNGIVISRSLFLLLRVAQEPKRIHQIHFMLMGVILSFIVGPIISALGDNVSTATGNQVLGAWVAEILGYGLISLGIILVSFSYLMNDEISLLRPQQMDRLIVILNSGLVIYEYRMRKSLNEKEESNLLGSALTAIQAIMQEALGAADLVSIRFKDAEIMVKLLPGAAVILVTDHANLYLQKTLDAFANYLQKNFLESLTKFTGETLDPAIVDGKVRQFFGLPSSP